MDNMERVKDDELVGGQLLLEGFEATSTGLVAKDTLTAEQWDAAGYILGKVDKRLMWYIGDWLIAGEDSGYLPDGKLEEACKRFGIAYSTAANAAWVCRITPQSSRRPELSFDIHKEVASREDAPVMLDWVQETGATREDLRREKRSRDHAARADRFGPAGDMPSETFQVIYADPPWGYDCDSDECDRSTENHYPRMSLDDIKALKVPAAKDCVLFMWVTSMLKEALEVIDAWGFKYKTNAVWAKDKIGLGFYCRLQHEILLIATKGKAPTPLPANRPSSLIVAPRLEHSQKPKQVYEMIEIMYPNARRLEMFSRSTDRQGWDYWGNQV